MLYFNEQHREICAVLQMLDNFHWMGCTVGSYFRIDK